MAHSKPATTPRATANLAILLLAAAAHACAPPEREDAVPPPPPWVLTTPLEPAGNPVIRVSGTVRARYETPVGFQVPGRVVAREVDSGQRVEPNQILFRLDTRDFDAAVLAAEAQLATAEAALETARAELERQERLDAQNATSRERLDRARLAEQDARGRLEAAKAELTRARNAREYAELRAAQPGVLIDVSAEPGQVVAPGQTVALLARDGEREIEVNLARGVDPPATGRVLVPEGPPIEIELREIAGAADPVSRTWRARYRARNGREPAAEDHQRDRDIPLGAVVQVELDDKPDDADVFRVPVSALDERGRGPRLWRVENGIARPFPVQIVAIDGETARVRIQPPPAPGLRVVALGAHLLNDGKSVRERPR